MEKYCYSLNKERYFTVSDNKEETIKEAFETLYFEKNKNLKLEEKIWIAETVEYKNMMLGDYVADTLSYDAQDFAGEYAEDFMALSIEHKKILNERLDRIIAEFQKEFGYEPDFFRVTNVEEIIKSKSEIEELIEIENK
jgi:hypothetical protein F3_00942|nr:MAG TPA: hypothetical protein [Caudoviricetes sp.]